MPICSVIRPPHRLGGVARSRSLFVATPPLRISPAYRRQGRPRRRDFAKLNLHLGIFDQPAKNDFFNRIFIPDSFYPRSLFRQEGMPRSRKSRFHGILNFLPGSLMVNTGQGDFLTTFSAVLPKRIWSKPVRP
jgi:hypothetical protein